MVQELAPGVSAPFLAVNRNKRGLALDLKRARGRARLERLAATADVLVENYRPGVVARLGLDYATLSRSIPRLIYCSISGFGQTGPDARPRRLRPHRAGHERHHERHGRARAARR